MLDDFGLFAALEWLFERFTRQSHIVVKHNFSFLDEIRFPRTVETHRANLMSKLELTSQADVVRYAIRHGLVPLTRSP